MDFLHTWVLVLLHFMKELVVLFVKEILNVKEVSALLEQLVLQEVIFQIL